MAIEVVCPSGLKGEVRGFKAKEANFLADKAKVKSGKAFDEVLSNCWLTTTDPGPYAAPNGSPLDWGKVLLCDRFFTLLKIREATYGDGYAFTVQCEDRQLCGERIDWELNLTDLPCDALPQASREKIAAGDNEFTAVLEHGEYAGREVVYRLQTGAGEKRSLQILQGQTTRLVVAALASRIVSVQGVEDKKGELAKFLDDLEMPDLMMLIETFDEQDGGVETTIDVVCQACGLQQEVELPLGRDFYLPRKKRRRTSRLDTL
jgi:hypothetical protein